MNKIIKILLTVMLIVIVIFDIAAITYLKTAEEITETVTATVTEQRTEPTTAKNNSLGVFKLTAYCPCTICSGKWGDMTATGVRAKENHTIAVDPSVIPYGTEVIINGHTYRAEDNGVEVKGKIIDIYFDTHEEAEYFRQYAEVFLVG